MKRSRILVPAAISWVLFHHSWFFATSLAGKVVDGSTGNPIAGVAIHLADSPFQATRIERFRFPVLIQPAIRKPSQSF